PRLPTPGTHPKKAFSTDAVRVRGEVAPPAGVFGVSIGVLPGAFHLTRVVTIWPRFLLCNSLGCNVAVIPSLEDPLSKEDGGAGAGAGAKGGDVASERNVAQSLL
ncbi:unnamed protein product, partial [Discosporangium mesarthrocarpum]